MLTAKQALLDGTLSTNNPFVETISYTAYGVAAASIRAVVSRTSGMLSGGQNSRPRYDCEIIISNDATSGIATVIPKRDIVTMNAPELNDAAHVFTVAAIIGKSAMGWRLGLMQ